MINKCLWDAIGAVSYYLNVIYATGVIITETDLLYARGSIACRIFVQT